MRLIDAESLMKNGWHLVRSGLSNRELTSMSLADVAEVDVFEDLYTRLKRVINHGAAEIDGRHYLSAELVLEYIIELKEESNRRATERI